MSARRDRMIAELRDAEYRESYAEHHLNSVLATQIRTVREQRGLTQDRLAKKIGKHQAAISRIENVNYARWNISTLKKVANSLGCWLDIRLESWGKLVEAVDEYSTENLRRERFEDDPVFWGSLAQGPVPETVRWVQQRLFPWLQDHAPEYAPPDPMLVNWLQGRDLPPVGDHDPPHIWIARAIEVEGPDSWHLKLMRTWLNRQIFRADETAGQVDNRGAFFAGVFNLAAAFHDPTWFWQPIEKLYGELKSRRIEMPAGAKSAFLTALIRNQRNFELKNEWLDTIESGSHGVLPANEWDGFEGLKWMPARPNLRAIAEGLKAMQIAAWDRPESGIDMVLLLRDVQSTFGEFGQLDQLLLREGIEISWPEEVLKAWQEVFVPTLEDSIRLADQWTGKQGGVLPNESLKAARIEAHAPGTKDPELLRNIDTLKKHQAMSATAGQR